MPDLNFTNLQTQLPANSIVAVPADNDVVISLKTLMNELSVSLSDEKVSEAISKLLEGCSKAQSAYNSVSSSDLNSYPPPVAGIPIQGSDGIWYAIFTHTVSVRVPLNRDAIVAVPM